MKAIKLLNMRLLLINLIALIISVTALHMSVDTDISFSKDGQDTLASLPLLEMEPIRNPTSGRSHEGEILSQKSLEAETYLATATYKAQDYLHYLPIYSLNRAKEYFLLI